MRVGRRFTYAALLWFASLLLMSLAVVLPDWTHLSGWSLLAATVACVPTGWLIVDHVVAQERLRTRQEIRDIARLVLDEQRGMHSV